MPLILGTNSIKDTGYNVANSLRFNSGSSDYLNRTPSGAGSTRLATFSLWLKRANISVTQYLYMVNDGTNQFGILFGSDNKLKCFHWNGSSYDFDLETLSVYRDVSAWLHIVIKIDTANGTAIERLKLFINGEYVAWNTTISQNFDGVWLKNSTTHIGATTTPSNYLNGYLAEFVAIDGTALEPTSFGEFDEDTPTVWKPKNVSGLTFGTNGFYLDFEDSSALGNDVSGNNNDFTVNNLTAIDQCTDTCTNNFCTMNPLSSHGSVTLAEGNTQVNVADNSDNCTSSFMVSSGKWYWEGKQTVGVLGMVGIRPEGMNVYQNSLFNLTGTYQGYYYYGDSGNQRPANTSYGATFGVNDIIGFALDLDSGTQTITFYKNGASQGAINIATSGLTWGFSYTSGGGSDTFQMNFGNPPFSISSGNSDANGYGNFEYSVPSGYYALNTKNLAEYG